MSSKRSVYKDLTDFIYLNWMLYKTLCLQERSAVVHVNLPERIYSPNRSILIAILNEKDPDRKRKLRGELLSAAISSNQEQGLGAFLKLQYLGLTTLADKKYSRLRYIQLQYITDLFIRISTNRSLLATDMSISTDRITSAGLNTGNRRIVLAIASELAEYVNLKALMRLASRVHIDNLSHTRDVSQLTFDTQYPHGVDPAFYSSLMINENGEKAVGCPAGLPPSRRARLEIRLLWADQIGRPDLAEFLQQCIKLEVGEVGFKIKDVDWYLVNADDRFKEYIDLDAERDMLTDYVNEIEKVDPLGQLKEIERRVEEELGRNKGIESE